MRIPNGAWLGLGLTILLMGCSSDEGTSTPECVQTFCEPGSKQCLGNAAATCASDGRAFSVAQCGSNALCEAGECTGDRVCGAFAGQTRCKDGLTLTTCSDDGTTLTEESCPDDTQCKAGACRPITCEAGTVECGFRELATCADNGNGWSASACGTDEICQGGECTAQTCQPGARRCQGDDTVQQCNLDGTAWVDTACGEGQACVAGAAACLPKLCEKPVETPDVVDTPDEGTDGTDGEPDVLDPDIPMLEPKETAEATIDGTTIEFTSNLSAFYVGADQDLRITMNKGQHKIEISLAPIEELDFGTYSSTEAGEVNVTIFYHDGSPLQGMAQFRYVSVDYEVTLEKFEQKGGRVKGTFSGTLTEDGGATTIPLTDGVFDVKRD